MDKEQKNKLENILFHEHSWSQKDINDLDMKIEDIIDAYEQTKQFAISGVVNRRELLLDFADYSESDKTSETTDECVDNYLDSIK